jgi:hypothetical protein
MTQQFSATTPTSPAKPDIDVTYVPEQQALPSLYSSPSKAILISKQNGTYWQSTFYSPSPQVPGIQTQ